jgi:hypothetical protein
MGLMKSVSGCGCETLFTSGEEWAKFDPIRHTATPDRVAGCIASIVPIRFPAAEKLAPDLLLPLPAMFIKYPGAIQFRAMGKERMTFCPDAVKKVRRFLRR